MEILELNTNEDWHRKHTSTAYKGEKMKKNQTSCTQKHGNQLQIETLKDNSEI